ncbi:uncharacterized protein JCM6883_000885 [Sporobolomyces salmoneus]|uniref:uncharacterized protein n=1 Tax=Sporobolomyces salmoneus TaxID=183962 RepID=UPI0031773DE3
MRFSLALVAFGLASTSVLATPPPDVIEALEAAKQQTNKRAVMHAMHHGKNHQKEKKWVVLPSSSLPSHLRSHPKESIFTSEDSHGSATTTALPTHRIHKKLQKRDETPSNSTISDAPAPSETAVAAKPATSSVSVDPLDPSTWPGLVTNQYNETKDQINGLSTLSKVGLAAIVIVGTAILLGLLVCCCKISRARTRRRKEKLRLKAEAAEAQLRRSTTGSSTRTSSSASPSSIISMDKKGGGVFGWMKKQPQEEMQQADSRRAQSLDLRARGFGAEPPQASGGSIKSRTRSWGGK